MKSYMPGEHGYTDHGPRTTVHPAVEAYAKDIAKVRVRMKNGEVKKLQDPRRYAFDRFGQGRNNAGTTGLVAVERSRRSDAEEDYLSALYEVFHAALERLSPGHRLYLRGLMDGKSTRQHAAEVGITQPAVVQGRQRALEALAKALGAEGLQDRPGIRRGIVRGTNFNITEFLPGFTEVA